MSESGARNEFGRFGDKSPRIYTILNDVLWADCRQQKSNACYSAWEWIARTFFPVNDVPKLQGNRIPCQRAVRGINFEDSEHAVSRRKILNACYSAWEAIDLTVIFR